VHPRQNPGYAYVTTKRKTTEIKCNRSKPEPTNLQERDDEVSELINQALEAK